jgi:hypothetical protein
MFAPILLLLAQASVPATPVRSTRRAGPRRCTEQPAEGILGRLRPPPDGFLRALARVGLAVVITAAAYADAIELHARFAPTPSEPGAGGGGDRGTGAVYFALIA